MCKGGGGRSLQRNSRGGGGDSNLIKFARTEPREKHPSPKSESKTCQKGLRKRARPYLKNKMVKNRSGLSGGGKTGLNTTITSYSRKVSTTMVAEKRGKNDFDRRKKNAEGNCANNDARSLARPRTRALQRKKRGQPGGLQERGLTARLERGAAL